MKNGEDTLRPHVTAKLFRQTVDMRKKFRRWGRWIDVVTLVGVAALVGELLR